MKLWTRRRGSDRIRVAWDGAYGIEGDEGWTRCRVLDVSLSGAALELPDGVAEPNGRLVVELERAATPESGIQLRAEVRNRSRTPEGLCRIGVEFVELTDLEVEVLSALMALQTP